MPRHQTRYLCADHSQETVRREILEDDGVQQRVMMEQAAMWRFLVFSGTFNVTLDILQNEKERFVSDHRLVDV